LGLASHERIVLAGAVDAVKDERKGFHLLAEAIRRCVSEGHTEDWRLLVFGANSGPGQETLGIPVSYCGSVNNERELPRVYAAADVYVLPSLQDNLPNTAVEAMACGVPVVAFRAGGLADIVCDGVNGRLANAFDVGSLAASLRAVLDRPRGAWRQACRDEFERIYAWPGPANRYLEIYRELL
jgi:glycosyltransferase involved in cell wall biosynthesis